MKVLNKYHSKGWLEFGNKMFSKDDRLEVGIRFAQDFADSNFENSGCIDYTKDRVDCSRNLDLSPKTLDARNRYNKALLSIPANVVDVIKTVCCFDKEVKIKKIDSKQYNHDMEMLKESICQGLDSLIEHYYGKIHHKRSKIVGYATVNIWDNMDDYIKDKNTA